MSTSAILSSYYQVYQIRLPKYWLVRDEPVDLNDFNHKKLLFHVSQNDYFSTLATILRFYEESVNDKNITEEEMRLLQSKIIKNIIQDLLYLEKNYVIVPKDRNRLDEKLN